MARKGQGLFICLDAEFLTSDHAQWLRRTLGCYGVLDYVVPLWLWAIKRELKDGIVNVTPRRLASIINWVGPIEQAWEAFTEPEIGLLEDLGDGRYRIRGWDAWAARIFRERERKAEWKRQQSEKECSGRRLPDSYPRDQIIDQDHDHESKRSERGGHTGRIAPPPLHKIDPCGDPPDLTEPAIAPEPQGCPMESAKPEVATQAPTEGTAPASGQISQSDHFASTGRVLLNLRKNHQDDDFSDFSSCPEQEKALPSADSPFAHRTCAMVRDELARRGVKRPSWSVAELRELIDLGPSQATVVAAFEAATAGGEQFRYGLFVSQLRPEARARAQAALQAKAKQPEQAQQKSAVRTESPRRAESQKAYVPLGRMTEEESARGAANARAIFDMLDKVSEGECKRERKRTRQTVSATEQTSPPSGDGSEVSGSL